MPNRTPRVILASLSLLFLLVFGVTAVAKATTPRGDDPTTSTTVAQPSGACDVPLHINAEDSPKNSPDSFGMPIENPTDLDSVKSQVDQAIAANPIVNRTMAWNSDMIGAPSDVNQINDQVAWSIDDNARRNQDCADLTEWLGTSTMEIVTVPAGTTYWTLANSQVDGRWMVYQTQVTLGQDEPFLQITNENDDVSLTKLSCYLQPARVEQFPGIPTQPPTHAPRVPKPPRTETTVPRGGTTETTRPHTTTTRPHSTTTQPHTTTTRPCQNWNPYTGKCDDHPSGRPQTDGSGGPQASNTDRTPDTQSPDGPHTGSDPGTGCHGPCTGGTPTTTRPQPPSTIPDSNTTVPATSTPTTVPGP